MFLIGENFLQEMSCRPAEMRGDGEKTCGMGQEWGQNCGDGARMGLTFCGAGMGTRLCPRVTPRRRTNTWTWSQKGMKLKLHFRYQLETKGTARSSETADCGTRL